MGESRSTQKFYEVFPNRHSSRDFQPTFREHQFLSSAFSFFHVLYFYGIYSPRCKMPNGNARRVFRGYPSFNSRMSSFFVVDEGISFIRQVQGESRFTLERLNFEALFIEACKWPVCLSVRLSVCPSVCLHHNSWMAKHKGTRPSH